MSGKNQNFIITFNSFNEKEREGGWREKER